jgi:hypothetical protein
MTGIASATVMTTMTQIYYHIRDVERLIAIHKIADSAKAAYQRIIKEEKYNSFIELVAIEVDQFGTVISAKLVYTYSTSSATCLMHDEETGTVFHV